MSRCAVCLSSTGLVVNMIVADASVDMAPDGCILVNVDDSSEVGIAWVWDGTQFIHPSKIETLTISSNSGA